ncbi:hypothetical protein PC9H_005804 [Pleurotus ostreatus]|uniref:Uncharacterized protein n=1 Tax=Pleurotus ostreatus TaxID=5322 RepID=A0A8H7DXD8_PLEOS|nr:uncharacterized protein PC9H_005804 [Pleurotus ostreatus]KAF7433838.1 hypothetical protein PC9H_005804 [Pleurotus ostreatus]
MGEQASKKEEERVIYSVLGASTNGLTGPDTRRRWRESDTKKREDVLARSILKMWRGAGGLYEKGGVALRSGGGMQVVMENSSHQDYSSAKDNTVDMGEVEEEEVDERGGQYPEDVVEFEGNAREKATYQLSKKKYAPASRANQTGRVGRQRAGTALRDTGLFQPAHTVAFIFPSRPEHTVTASTTRDGACAVLRARTLEMGPTDDDPTYPSSTHRYSGPLDPATSKPVKTRQC